MALPKNMKYIDHGAGGPASSMQLREGPLPQLKSGEVLIEVAYAGVNRPDVLQRAGAYPPPAGASPVLGLEVAGKIIAIDNTARAKSQSKGYRGGKEEATQSYSTIRRGADDDANKDSHMNAVWQIGDMVCALTPGGGYAEYCLAPAAHCLPVPQGLTLAEAAALPENYFTVWSNVFDRGRLQAGENFLVHGGAGGIGYTAIQLAKAFGSVVFTTVTGEEKIAAVKKFGADVVIDYKKQDWAEEIKKIVGRQGIDCILDFVGGEYIQKNLKLLGTNGRLVQIAFLQGSKVELDCMPILTRNLTFTGSTLRPRSTEEKAAIAQALLKNVWPLLETKKLGALIHKVFPLEEAPKAHELMESSEHIGKIVLKIK